MKVLSGLVSSEASPRFTGGHPFLCPHMVFLRARLCPHFLFQGHRSSRTHPYDFIFMTSRKVLSSIQSSSEVYEHMNLEGAQFGPSQTVSSLSSLGANQSPLSTGRCCSETQEVRLEGRGARLPVENTEGQRRHPRQRCCPRGWRDHPAQGRGQSQKVRVQAGFLALDTGLRPSSAGGRRARVRIRL